MLELLYMFLESPLTQLGLSEKEAKIYLATLELGSDTVQNIAEKAKVKRPTTYVILNDLVQKGLVSEKPTSKGSIFIAEDPDKLLRMLKEKQRTLQDALPFLHSLHNVEKGKPQVKVYEGIEGMRQVYFDTVWKSKTEILFFSSIKKIYEAIPDLLNLWLEDMNKEKNRYYHHTRELINSDPEDIEYGLKASKNTQQIRIVPKNFPLQFVGTDNAIFEDKIMLVSFDQKLFTTIIQSKVLADTMRVLYELAWQQSTPIEEFTKQNPD